MRGIPKNVEVTSVRVQQERSLYHVQFERLYDSLGFLSLPESKNQIGMPVSTFFYLAG